MKTSSFPSRYPAAERLFRRIAGYALRRIPTFAVPHLYSALSDRSPKEDPVSAVLKHPSPDEDLVAAQRSAGVIVRFNRSPDGASMIEYTSEASVSSVGAPAEIQRIARGIVMDFGEALEQLAE